MTRLLKNVHKPCFDQLEELFSVPAQKVMYMYIHLVLWKSSSAEL